MLERSLRKLWKEILWNEGRYDKCNENKKQLSDFVKNDEVLTEYRIVLLFFLKA